MTSGPDAYEMAMIRRRTDADHLGSPSREMTEIVHQVLDHAVFRKGADTLPGPNMSSGDDAVMGRTSCALDADMRL